MCGTVCKNCMSFSCTFFVAGSACTRPKKGEAIFNPQRRPVPRYLLGHARAYIVLKDAIGKANKIHRKVKKNNKNTKEINGKAKKTNTKAKTVGVPGNAFFIGDRKAHGGASL